MPVAAKEKSDEIKVKPPQEEPIHVDADILESRLMRKVNPEYPEQAKLEGIEGSIKLTITVNEEGNVYEIKTDPENNPILEKAAIDAVKKWKYNPILLNAKPVPVIATATVVFSLKDATPPGQAQKAPSEIKVPKSKPLKIVSEGEKWIHTVQPVYPEEAIKAGIQGQVLLEVTINEEGLVYDVRVVQGHPLLAKAAVAAVKQWQCKPTLLNNEPVPSIIEQTVIFHLK
jgi:TonB family protein